MNLYFKELYKMDMARYNNKAPLYIKMLMFTLRKAQKGCLIWKALFRLLANCKLLEISPITKIGGVYTWVIISVLQ